MTRGPAPTLSPGGRRYLDLLEKVLTRELFADEEWRDVALADWPGGADEVLPILRANGWRLVRRPEIGARDEGRDWPAAAETMVGRRRLANVRQCATQVLHDEIPGDFLEAGVWRGGVTIFLRAVLAAYGVEHRRVWVADSFQGLPEPDGVAYPADAHLDWSDVRVLAVDQATVEANFARFGLLDGQVRFLPGWFRDTLPAAPIDQLSLLRLDGDLYESTMDGLRALYPKLSPGGYCIVDDYHGWESCGAAVDDYRREHGISEPIETIDWTGAYWRRSG